MAATVSGDNIADCVLKVFDSLAKKYKPVRRTESQHECTVLSGIVLERGKYLQQSLYRSQTPQQDMRCNVSRLGEGCSQGRVTVLTDIKNRCEVPAAVANTSG